MIRIENGKLEIKGSREVLEAELFCIIDKFLSSNIVDNDCLELMLRISNLTEEEASAEMEKIINENKNLLEKLMHIDNTLDKATKLKKQCKYEECGDVLADLIEFIKGEEE